MLILISPAKSLNFASKEYKIEPTQAQFRRRAKELADIMKNFNADELQNLMGISEDLAVTNVKRFNTFKKIHNTKNSKAAIYAFNGDVYRGLDVESLNKADISYAQDHLRILSGLYGRLKPMDLIQEYRLEMGSRPKRNGLENLYKYWDNDVTKQINKDLKKIGSKTILNLASKEYFSVLKPKLLKAEIINVNFREFKNGELKFISYTAKVARGLMANYVIKNKIDSVEGLKGFNADNYYYDDKLSSNDNLFFVR